MSTPFLTDEPLRIVRPYRPGEKLPEFSIVHALMGSGANYGIKTPGRKPGPRKGYANKGSLKAAQSRTQEAMEARGKHATAISQMLKEFRMNPEIAEQIGITSDRVARIISSFEELRMLSKKRAPAIYARTNQKPRLSRESFCRQREEIMRFLTTGSLTAACVVFKFDHRKLKKYLAEDEVKNGK